MAIEEHTYVWKNKNTGKYLRYWPFMDRCYRTTWYSEEVGKIDEATLGAYTNPEAALALRIMDNYKLIEVRKITTLEEIPDE